MKCGAQVSPISSLLAENLYKLYPTFLWFFGNSWELYSPTCFLCLLWLDITKLITLFSGHCFFFVGKVPFWGLLEPTLLWTSFVTCDTCFRSIWRRLKLNYLLQHEKLSVNSVLLLGSSPVLYILVPRRQVVCLTCGTYNKPIFLHTVFQRLSDVSVIFQNSLSHSFN